MAAEPGATASVDLTADSSSAGAARAFVRSVLSGWGCADELVDDALLAATELVTNALLYGSPPFAASLLFKAGGRVRISVRDGSPLLPALRKYGTNASTGRGLALVEAIGRWGAELGAGGGKVVWAELGGVVGTGEVPSPEAAPDDLDRQLVRFLGVPVVTYLALEAHNDAATLFSRRQTCGGTKYFGEICRSYPEDGSVHLKLHPADVKMVLESGWGERSPQGMTNWWWKCFTGAPTGDTLIYAPQSEQELSVVTEIIRAAVWWVAKHDSESWN